MQRTLLRRSAATCYMYDVYAQRRIDYLSLDGGAAARAPIALRQKSRIAARITPRHSSFTCRAVTVQTPAKKIVLAPYVPPRRPFPLITERTSLRQGAGKGQFNGSEPSGFRIVSSTTATSSPAPPPLPTPPSASPSCVAGVDDDFPLVLGGPRTARTRASLLRSKFPRVRRFPHRDLNEYSIWGCVSSGMERKKEEHEQEGALVSVCE